MRGFAIRLGVIGVIVVAWLILRPFLTGNAGDLRVGDCFDTPSADQQAIKDVQHHPCEETHGGEVIFVGDYPGSGSDPYPTTDEMLSFLAQRCVPAYQTYTGVAIDSQRTYDIAWFQPTEDGWKGGDQTVICYAYRLDETRSKGSLKAG